MRGVYSLAQIALCAQWNPNEGTFDCPCHGSHFDNRGNVINGPARSNLELVELGTFGVKSAA